ncbi:DUF4167 domain-containing protein [Acidocella sp.]|uniref:DUF4167 domain-containing protein n=1 Tax=Acidocella sp. TaxID=50710 RepID=UPI0038D0C1ED
MNIKRMRGRNHRPGGGGGGGGGGFRNQQNGIPLNRNHVFDSSGPEMRVRGTAQQLYDKYQQLARDASSNGDRVLGEAYYQHAEHYFRIISAINQAQGVPNPAQGGQQPNNQNAFQRRETAEGEPTSDPRPENRPQNENRRFEQRPYEPRQKPEFQRQDRPERTERQDRQDRPERHERLPRSEPALDMRIDISSALEAELAAAVGEPAGLGEQPVIMAVPVAAPPEPKPIPIIAKAPPAAAPAPAAVPADETPPLVLTPAEVPRVPRPRGRPRLVKADKPAQTPE